MCDLTLESLLITEEDWGATEGFGETIKKAGGFVWDKIVALAKKISDAIMFVVEKINRKLDKLKAKMLGTKAVEAIDLRPMIKPYINDLKRTYTLTEKEMKVVFSKRDQLARETGNELHNALSKRAHLVGEEIQKVHEKYPSYDSIPEGKLRKKTVNATSMTSWVTECKSELLGLRENVRALQAQSEKIRDGLNAYPKLPFEQMGSVCRQWLRESSNCTAYLAKQVESLTGGTPA